MRTCLDPSFFPFELGQLLFWLFKYLIRWRNIVLEFSLKVIFRRWMFRVDGNHFILNRSWLKLSQSIMVFFLETYQLFFLFFRTLIRWRNMSLDFFSKWSSEYGCSEVIVSTSFWMCSDENMIDFLLGILSSASDFLLLF